MQYLQHLEFFGIKLGLDQITELLERLGNPHEKLRFIHVAGTNGKGSTCALIESGLRQCGFKTGFYSSPHLVKVNERFRINGVPITDTEFERISEIVRIHADAMKDPPSFFEFATALAALWFAEQQCDFVLWETGMGGRLDATNVVVPILTVITRIGFDHQAFLGNTLTAIAGEKAGILKPGIRTVIGLQPSEAESVLTAQAQIVGAPRLSLPDAVQNGQISPDPTRQTFNLEGHAITLSLAGTWQRENALTAYTALRELSNRYGFNLAEALKGWKTVCWPARFQFVSKDLILDGAHNPDGAAVLLESWRAYFGDQKATLLFANFSDKETLPILEKLCLIANAFIFVPITGAKERPSASGETLSRMVHQISAKLPCYSAPDIQDAIRHLEQAPGLKLVTGSLYLAGAFCAAKQNSVKG